MGSMKSAAKRIGRKKFCKPKLFGTRARTMPPPTRSGLEAIK